MIFPAEYVKPAQNLRLLVQEYPMKAQVWDSKTKALLFTLGSALEGMEVVSFKTPTDTRGAYGILPLLRHMKAGSIRVWLLGHGEVTLTTLRLRAVP